MTFDLSALCDLFPDDDSKCCNESEARIFDGSIRGPFPFDRLHDVGGVSPRLAEAILSVRSDLKWGPIYRGDLSAYHGDHSRADLALCGELARKGLTYDEIDQALRSSNLYREKWERDNYRKWTIDKALGGRASQNSEGPSESRRADSEQPSSATADFLNLERGRVQVQLGDAQPRNYNVQDLLLPKKSAVLAGLGGVSKTQFAIQLAVHAALGKPIFGNSVRQGQVLLLLGEEDHDEIKRRVNAIAKKMVLSPSEISLVEDNFYALPLEDQDLRLTKRENRDFKETGLSRQIIEKARALSNLRLIVLDHVALFHGGDFIAREEAALTMRQVNRIACDTGASVLLLAHSPKSAISSDEVNASMVAGSTAFVDHARGAWILCTMRKEEARDRKIADGERPNYVSLTIVKNNYGPAGTQFWFKRTSQDGIGFLESTNLDIRTVKTRRQEELEHNIIRVVAENPGRYTRTRIRDTMSGEHGFLQASKGTIDQVIDRLLDNKRLLNRTPTAADRQMFGHPSQVRMVLAPPVT